MNPVNPNQEESMKRERKITISQAEKLSDREALIREAFVLRAAIELAKYHHKRYLDTLNGNLAKIEVELKYGPKGDPQ